MNDVRISPPYQQDNCTGTTITAVERVKKIVCYWNESINDWWIRYVEFQTCHWMFKGIVGYSWILMGYSMYS